MNVAEAVARSSAVAEVLVREGALARAGEVFARHFGGGRACLLADEASWAAAGPAVEAALRAAGVETRAHVLPATPRPKPTVELSRALAEVAGPEGAVPVAIGSGVMNDVVKHAAFGLGRPYLCVATAASMDGYTSAGAPLSEGGFKMTIPCRPARAVIADLDVIAAAPPRMIGWGYGDLAGKVPAGADWIVADALGIEPLDDVAWPMVQGGLRDRLAGPARLRAGDRAACEALFCGLTLVGLAMEAHGSSRPASGADHQIAHLWEMEGLSQGGEVVSHGACVAVGCVATLALYDWLLAQDLTGIDAARIAAAAPGMEAEAAAVARAFGPGEVARRALAEVEAKHAPEAGRRARLERLRAIWPELRGRLRAQVLPPAEMAAMLAAAGAPAASEEIGVSRDALRRTVRHARFLRRRYTVLDLLEEVGMLDAAIDAALPARAPA